MHARRFGSGRTDRAPYHRPRGQPSRSAAGGDRSTRVLLAVAITVTAWASAFVAIRGVRDSFEPARWRSAACWSAASRSAAAARARTWVRPPAGVGHWSCSAASRWFAVYNVALNAAEHRVDAGTAAMLVNVGPILIALLAGLLLGEGFPRWLLLGAAVAFAGAAADRARRPPTRRARDLVGVALCLAAALAWAIGVLAQKPALRRLPACRSPGWRAPSAISSACPSRGQLVRETSHATGGSVRRGPLPRARAHRHRVLHLGLRALAHVGRAPRRGHLPRPADHDRDRVAHAG